MATTARLLAVALLAPLLHIGGAISLAPLRGGLAPAADKNNNKGRLKVAYAVFVTDLDSPAWQDAMAVMAHSLKKAKAKSRHDAKALVLAPERFPDDKKDMLLSFGFDEVIRKPPPVRVDEVQNPNGRAELGHTQGTGAGLTFALEEETIKYWGMAQTQFDRVLVLDADIMVLDPMDELMELPEDFAGVYDHGVDMIGSRLPPAQGGFLLFRPNATDFEAIKDLTREGDFRLGSGWRGSGVGYWYGGIGPDGLLEYYYNKDALGHLGPAEVDHRELKEGINAATLPGSRMKPLDAAVYDVLIIDRLAEDLQGTDAADVAKGVKSAHFTGNCLKPWSCWTPSGDRPGDDLCAQLHDRWWGLWSEVASERVERGVAAPESRCHGGQYVGLPKA